MWLEIKILRPDEETDWASMGVKKPKNYRPDTVTVRRLIYIDNIVWVEECPTGCLIQLMDEEEPINIADNYTDIVAIIRASEPEDLEA